MSKGWHWLWRDAGPGERIVVIVAALAILSALAFTLANVIGGGGVCHCGP